MSKQKCQNKNFKTKISKQKFQKKISKKNSEKNFKTNKISKKNFKKNINKKNQKKISKKILKKFRKKISKKNSKKIQKKISKQNKFYKNFKKFRKRNFETKKNLKKKLVPTSAARGAAVAPGSVDPAVGVGLSGRKRNSFGEAVLVLDARIGLLVQQHHVEGLGDGTLAVDRLRRQKGVRFAFVVERGAGELHFARKVDPPVAVQVVMAGHVPHGCNPTTFSSFWGGQSHLVSVFRTKWTEPPSVSFQNEMGRAI
jgi:hypothetical protein